MGEQGDESRALESLGDMAVAGTLLIWLGSLRSTLIKGVLNGGRNELCRVLEEICGADY